MNPSNAPDGVTHTKDADAFKKIPNISGAGAGDDVKSFITIFDPR